MCSNKAVHEKDMEHPTVLTTIPLNFELVRIGPQLKKQRNH